MTDNRAKILDCALELFAARGYDAVGVQEIVETAGTTKPALYHYFGSKAGLMKTLLNEHFEELYGQLEQASAYHHDLTLNLYRIVGVYFRYVQDHRRLYRLQLALWFAPPESEIFKAVAFINHKQQERIEELFALAAADHGNMRDRQRTYAATFLGMINSYIALYLNGYIELNDELIYKAVHQFMHGIFS